MIDVSDEDWNLYERKFGKLMNYIAKRISGDPAICCHDENMQDLRMTALHSIYGFYRKNNCYDRPCSDVIEDPLFASYTKTSLWNRKNNKGQKATRHKNNFTPYIEDMDDGR